jgi:hypothetical protein
MVNLERLVAMMEGLENKTEDNREEMKAGQENIVAYIPAAGQRTGNGQVQPLLCNRRRNKRPFLTNGSVNTYP